MPRSAPAATVWMPSATKNVAPTISSVAVSSMTAPSALDGFAEEKSRDRKSGEDHGERHGRHEDYPETRRHKACALHRRRIAASDRVTDPHGRRDPDAERYHEQDCRDLQRDLMSRQRRGADQAHQQRRSGEQAVFEEERDRDGSADDDQSPHQHPVDAPDAAQHLILPERRTAIGKPEARQKHPEIDDRG